MLPQSTKPVPDFLVSSLKSALERNTLQAEDTTDKLLGASFIVVDRSGIIFSGASGRLDLPVDSTRWELDTPVWAASLTKLLTSIAFYQQLELGNIDIKSDVAHELPDLATQPILEGFNDNGEPITTARTHPIRPMHLLTHTSGIPYDFLKDNPIRQWNDLNRRSVTCNDWSRQGFNNPLLFEPGTRFAYGAGLDWAAFLLEKKTGMSLSRYIREVIIEKVGDMMDATFYPGQIEGYAERMPAVVRRGTGGMLEPTTTIRPPKLHEVESGGAGLYCTALDYASLLRQVLLGEDGVVLLNNDRRLFDPQLTAMVSKSMEEQMKTLWGPAYKDIYDLGEGGCNHSCGGMVVMRGIPGRKKTGSIMWGGARNSHWWIDREAGVAAVLITSIEPLGDHIAAKLYTELETALYNGLNIRNAEIYSRPPHPY